MFRRPPRFTPLPPPYPTRLSSHPSRPLPCAELSTALAVATATIPADFAENPESSLIDLYVIAHAVEGLPPGTYYLRRTERALELLEAGEFRAIASRSEEPRLHSSH